MPGAASAACHAPDAGWTSSTAVSWSQWSHAVHGLVRSGAPGVIGNQR